MRRLNPSHGFALVTCHQVLHHERARAAVFCYARLVRETIIRIREECKCNGIIYNGAEMRVAERGMMNDRGKYIAA